MEPTLVVCSSKVHALGKLLNTELAEHILGFAVGEVIMPEAAPGCLPDHCRKCRAAAQVDLSDRRLWRAWDRCRRARRVQMERLADDLANLERDGR